MLRRVAHNGDARRGLSARDVLSAASGMPWPRNLVSSARVSASPQAGLSSVLLPGAGGCWSAILNDSKEHGLGVERQPLETLGSSSPPDAAALAKQWRTTAADNRLSSRKGG